MSEGFLGRWSRRKREVANSETAQPETAPPETAAAVDDLSRELSERTETRASSTAAEPAQAASESVIDLSQLPSLESITADTDIRAFLAPGVPASLRHAALRRAWAADPTIRDFVGLSENAWDFTAPDGVPGFGPIGNAEEVQRLLAQLVGAPTDAAEKSGSEPAEELAQAAATTEESAPGDGIMEEMSRALPPAREEQSGPDQAATNGTTELLQHNKEFAAMQRDDEGVEYEPTHGRRAHGRALPE